MNLEKLKSLIKNPKSFFYTKDEENTFLVLDWFAGSSKLKNKYSSDLIFDICESITDTYSWFHIFSSTMSASECAKKTRRLKLNDKLPEKLLKVLFLKALSSPNSDFTQRAFSILKSKLPSSISSAQMFEQSMNAKNLTITYEAVHQKVFDLASSDPRLVWIKELINLELTPYFKNKCDVTNLIFKMYVSQSEKEKEFFYDILSDVWDIKSAYRSIINLELERYARNPSTELDYDWNCDLDLSDLFTDYPAFLNKIMDKTLATKGFDYLKEARDNMIKMYGPSDTMDGLTALIEKRNLNSQLISPALLASPLPHNSTANTILKPPVKFKV